MWPTGFSVRLVGTTDCLKCSAFRQYLDAQKYPYEFYDADVPEHQQQLNQWMITDMPVIQILKNGDKVHQFMPGIKSTKTIVAMMNQFGGKK
jgi:hypothetical protein